MNTTIRCCVIYTLTGTFTLLNAPWAAADDLPEDGAKYNDIYTEEILVTARKREERLQDVPISISVFNTEFLDSPTVDDISHVANFSPNVEFGSSPPISGSSNASAVFIRGIGQNDFLSTNDPGVGIYLDGVYIARSVGSVLKINDVERVEVLRGPQGTLFGKNTIGGAIQVISRKPENKFQTDITLTGGSENRRDTALSVEGGLAQNLNGRVSILDENRDGYVKRNLSNGTLGNINRSTFKGILHWQASNNIEFSLTGDHTTQRQNAAAEVQIEIQETRDLSSIPPSEWSNWETFNTLIAEPQQGVSWDARWLPYGDGYNTFGTGPSQDDLDVNGVSLVGNFTLTPTLYLTSITSHRQMQNTLGRDADGSPLAYGHLVTDDDQSQFSQELRLTGENGEHLTWTTGLYFLKEDIHNRQSVTFLDGLFIATGGAADATFDVTNKVDVESRALFGQVSWRLTDKFSLTGGARVTREEKDFYVNIFTVNTDQQLLGPTQNDTDSWTDTSGLFTANYHLNNDGIIYFSYSEGFKGGGYNGRSVNPLIDPDTNEPVIDTFDPEEATSYELGYKQQFGRSYIQSSVFNTDYTNMQVSVLTAGANNLLAVTIDNAAKAQIRGAELEFNTQVFKNINLNTGIGYLDASYSELDDNTLLDKDAKLQKVPKWNVHIRGEYELSTKSLSNFTFVVEASYKSKAYNDPLNAESISQPGFTLINGFIDWTDQSEHWKVKFFVNNMGNKRYYLSGASELESVGTSSATYGRRREWGITLGYTH